MKIWADNIASVHVVNRIYTYTYVYIYHGAISEWAGALSGQQPTGAK